MLIGAQFALPSAVAAGVGAGSPEIGTAAEKPAVAQDQHATVSALHAVEHMHMHVKGIKPVLHGPRYRPRPGVSSHRVYHVSEFTKQS
jgi:hypothetical protein